MKEIARNKCSSLTDIAYSPKEYRWDTEEFDEAIKRNNLLHDTFSNNEAYTIYPKMDLMFYHEKDKIYKNNNCFRKTISRNVPQTLKYLANVSQYVKNSFGGGGATFLSDLSSINISRAYSSYIRQKEIPVFFPTSPLDFDGDILSIFNPFTDSIGNRRNRLNLIMRKILL